MKTVKFDGTQLSPGQRRMLEQQRHIKSFMSPVLEQQVVQILAVLDVRKEQGAKPEKQWFESREDSWTGTVSVAEWMGY